MVTAWDHGKGIEERAGPLFLMWRHVWTAPSWHVWTAPSWQALSSRSQHWSVRPCVRPLGADFPKSPLGLSIEDAGWDGSPKLLLVIGKRLNGSRRASARPRRDRAQEELDQCVLARDQGKRDPCSEQTRSEISARDRFSRGRHELIMGSGLVMVGHVPEPGARADRRMCSRARSRKR